ncbi:MAG: DUF2332 domain-containing protein [Phenylobacterium sp.]|nr:MAG: DUF2332 domain-containing protein [Phenylobacterium sp.]
MNADHDLVHALRLQAEVCREFGSPFNGAMLAHMADDLEAGGPVAELLAPWRGASRQKILHDAAPIRLVNAFTYLAMGDETPELSRAYPRDGAPCDAATAWRLARALVSEHRAALTAFMTHEPQTNEVRRSGVLLGGFLTVAQATGLPLRTFEIGASAGLNVLWDRFRYRLGEASWGDPAAAVVIPVDWSGPLPPLDVQPRVIARAACDRRPTDLADLASAVACWPAFGPTSSTDWPVAARRSILRWPKALWSRRRTPWIGCGRACVSRTARRRCSITRSSGSTRPNRRVMDWSWPSRNSRPRRPSARPSPGCAWSRRPTTLRWSAWI